MNKEDYVTCHLCGAEIGIGWRLERSRKPTLHLCEDCYELIDGAVRSQFPGHVRDLADFAQDRQQWDVETTNKFKYFELGAEEGEGK